MVTISQHEHMRILLAFPLENVCLKVESKGQ